MIFSVALIEYISLLIDTKNKIAAIPNMEFFLNSLLL